MRRTFIFTAFLLLLAITLSCNRTDRRNPLSAPALPVAIEDREQDDTGEWNEILEENLHLLGHRNWILVVDKAFPEQSSPGMSYLYAEEDLLPVLEQVLRSVDASTHVRAGIYRDKELEYITEEQVPGIGRFRDEIDELLNGRQVNTLLHDEVFGMLDQSSSLFRILVIKTRCNIPYSSVFLQLDCAYWDEDQERDLRERMEADQAYLPERREADSRSRNRWQSGCS